MQGGRQRKGKSTWGEQPGEGRTRWEAEPEDGEKNEAGESGISPPVRGLQLQIYWSQA